MILPSRNNIGNFNNFSYMVPPHLPYGQPVRKFTKAPPPCIQIKNTIDGPSAWAQVAYGMKWLPVSTAVQVASIGVGILNGWTDFATVKGTYFPPVCPIPDFLPLAQQRLMKVANFQIMTNLVPIEEFLFRVLLQDVILTKAPKRILQKWAPSKVHWVESTPAKVARVIACAAAFSAYHLQNALIQGVTPSMLNMQLCNTFGMGLVLGTLQEKTKNAWASLGLHLGCNLLVFGVLFRKCW